MEIYIFALFIIIVVLAVSYKWSTLDFNLPSKEHLGGGRGGGGRGGGRGGGWGGGRGGWGWGRGGWRGHRGWGRGWRRGSWGWGYPTWWYDPLYYTNVVDISKDPCGCLDLYKVALDKGVNKEVAEKRLLECIQTPGC